MARFSFKAWTYRSLIMLYLLKKAIRDTCLVALKLLCHVDKVRLIVQIFKCEW